MPLDSSICSKSSSNLEVGNRVGDEHGGDHQVFDVLSQRKLNSNFLNLIPYWIHIYKAWIFGRVIEFIGYVQHSTFCDLGKFKKELEFEFKNFRNTFGEGKEYENKRE